MEHRTEEAPYKVVGDRLIELRGKVRQKTFADTLGIAVNSLGRYERGERLPDGDVLVRLLAQGTDLNWLLKGFESGAFGINGSEPKGYRLPESAKADLVQLPVWDVKVSAGPGAEVFEPSIREFYGFTPAFLRAIGIKPEHGFVFQVDGDSMSPTLEHREFAIGDSSVRTYEGSGVYVIANSTKCQVKRLNTHVVSGEMQVISDNATKYPTVQLSADQADDIRIFGRVHRAITDRDVK